MTRFHFFKWWHECSFSGVLIKHQFGTKLCKQSPPKFHPQDFLEHGLLQAFLFYGIENLSTHSFPAEWSFVRDDYYSFLISTFMSKLCHVLAQNFWTFQLVLKIFMTHPIIWAVLKLACPYSCFPFDF